jgi:hypothetical protein
MNDRSYTRLCWGTLVATIAAASLASGCRNMASTAPEQLEQGLVWLFPGVEGGPEVLTPACKAFREEGVTAAFEIHDWSRPFGLFVNLARYDENREDAAAIAAKIASYHAEHPRATIDLVGYSGGGGMAVMVAEALPSEVRLRHVVLCQPALSPRYDLQPALQHVDGVLQHYHAPWDWFILGFGTSTFGNMDRTYETAAGRVGFDADALAGAPHLADRLQQATWTPEMMAYGHLGGHLGILMKGWNRRYVAPYLLPCGPKGQCLACGIRH